jgi:hypothetical protein
VQMICIWYIVNSFRLCVIYDDVEVLWLIDYIDVYMYRKILLMSRIECAGHVTGKGC